jgi:hydroxymethylbilane synthase
VIIRIATRQSALALWQAEFVAGALRNISGVSGVELRPMSTRGDEILDRSLQKIGGKGLFIKELESAMQDDRADIAVHSMKDVPAEMPQGFRIGAVLARANPGDALVTPDGGGLASLKHGARIGSSSLRRQAQLKAIRPDIDVRPLRGNVNTRLAKLDDGQYDAIVLACAGLERLGFAGRISEQFSPRQLLPAAGQGAIGVECLQQRADLLEILRELRDDATALAVTAERAVSRRLEASCQSPVASFATFERDELFLRALVAAPDGSQVMRAELRGASAEAESLGFEVATMLLDRGAAELLQDADT